MDLDNLKKYYDIGEKANWNIFEIRNNIDIPMFNFFECISEYVKKCNIVPTKDLIDLFLLDNNRKSIDVITLWKLMNDKEKNILNFELKNLKRECYKLFYEISNEEDLEFYSKYNISKKTIQKFSDIYIKSYIKVDDFTEEIMMKICYQLCEKFDWDAKIISLNTNLTIVEIRKYSIKYIKEVLKEKMNEKQFYFFLNYSIRTILEQYADITNFMIEENFIDKRQLEDVEWLNNIYRERVLEFCYGLLQNSGYNNAKLQKFCNEKNISFNNVRNCSLKYISEKLSNEERNLINEKKYLEGIKSMVETQREEKKKNPSEKMIIYNRLMKASTEEEIIKIVESYSGKYTDLKRDAFDCLIVHSSDYSVDEIKDKLQIYYEYIDRKRHEQRESEKDKRFKKYAEENLSKAQETIKEFLKDKNQTIEDFCDIKNIYRSDFEKYVELIRQLDTDLYEKYSNHNKRIRNKNFLIILMKIKKMINQIKNGVEENGIIRRFDLVDYYKTTKLTFKEVLEFSNGRLSIEEYKILRTFIVSNCADKKLTNKELNKLYDSKTIVGVQFDKNGKMIEGSGREITKEDKMNLIYYLKSNNIPVTQKTYNIVYKRWLSGELDVVQEINKKRK